MKAKRRNRITRLHLSGPELSPRHCHGGLNLRCSEPEFEADKRRIVSPLRVAACAVAIAVMTFPLRASAHAQSVFFVTTTADLGPGSLRQAILDANAHPGADMIRFDIPDPGPHTIQPQSSLPHITDPLVIDGYSQPGAVPNSLAVGHDGVIDIQLDGSKQSDSGGAGLWFDAGESLVRGLALYGFLSPDASSIRLQDVNGCVLEGNFVGTDATGINRLGNSYGIWVEGGAGNRIGGTGPAARNIIGGSVCFDLTTFTSCAGIALKGSVSNQVVGNYIGLGSDGSTVVANSVGLWLYRSSHTHIGGSRPGAGNVISGCESSGCLLEQSSNNSLQGNLVGTDALGFRARRNGEGIDILLDSNFNLVGGTNDGARNVISGNQYAGIFVQGSSNLIAGNFIGPDITGGGTLGNAYIGLSVFAGTNNVIGGQTVEARNVISDNENGLWLAYLDFPYLVRTVVQGNLIGTDVSGTNALPNRRSGILIQHSTIRRSGDSIIGGTNESSFNLISGNLQNGILITDDNQGCVAGSDWISGNRIGTDVSGTHALGNRGAGVYIQNVSGNIIGDRGAVSGNLIAHNAKGVVVAGQCSTNNRIVFNSIYANSDGAIDLGGGAVDPGDDDLGPNRLQNPPHLALAAIDSGRLTVEYLVDSTPENSFYPLTIDFYSTSQPGDAYVHLGSDAYLAVQAGQPHRAILNLSNRLTHLGQSIVGTATDANGNTSPLSNLRELEFVAEGPHLRIALAPNNTVRLTWPVTTIPYSLEHTGNLVSGSTWLPVDVSPRIAAEEYSVELPRTLATRYYRLHRTGQ